MTSRALLLAGFLALTALATLPAAAQQRVVAVGGDVTEIVYALGRGDRLVAADTTSLYPEAARALPKVGYMRMLAAEGILALRPDLLLAAADAGPPAALDDVARAGVRVLRLPESHDAGGVAAKVEAIAHALAAEPEGAALEQRIRRAFAALPPAPSRPERVLFLLGAGGGAMLASGAGTAADDAIRLAGGRNAIDGYRGYRPLAPEAIIAAAPDVVLVTRETTDAIGGPGAVLTLPGIAATPAGRARRVLVHEAMALLGFGPRTPETLAVLAGELRASNAPGGAGPKR